MGPRIRLDYKVFSTARLPNNVVYGPRLLRKLRGAQQSVDRLEACPLLYTAASAAAYNNCSFFPLHIMVKQRTKNRATRLDEFSALVHSAAASGNQHRN